MSEYKAVLLEPRSDVEPVDPTAIGFYAMPVMANLENTGDRIQTMVDELGIPFIMSDLYAQNKREVFGHKTKDANRVSGDIYRDMSRRRLDFVRDQLDAFGTFGNVIAMGDSLGVPAVQGMQLHGPQDQTFDALLLRDGWNLKSSTGKARGIGRYALYQVKDGVHGVLSSDKRIVNDYGYGEQDLDEPDETGVAEKLSNVADAMRGPENRKNAIILAGQAAATGAAVNLVCLANGLSGSPREAKQFIVDARSKYNDVAREMPAEVRTQTRLRAEQVSGWHSDLLDPARGATDVKNTLRLL